MKCLPIRAAAALLVLACASAAASGLSIESRVLDPDGKGLAGARVELWPVLRIYDRGVRELEGKQPEPAARAVTEADGWFRFPVPAEGPWKVTVSAEDFPQMFWVYMVIGEETLEPVRMGSKAAEGSRWRPVPPPVPKRAAADLRPWLLEVSDRGKAVRDALIRDEFGLVVGRTGKDGTLLVEGPKTGGWDVRVETRDGRLGSYLLPPIPAKTRANAKVWMKMLFPPPVALTGRVVDRATGQPVAGALVWPREDPAAFQVTDSRGEYRLPIWSAKAWVQLSAAAEGYFGGSSEPFFVEEDKGTSPTLALWPSSFLAGTIVDEDGQPVEQAEVRIYAAGSGSSDDPVVRVRTSGQGTFRITSLPKGWCDLDVRRPGFVPLRVPGVELRPDSAVDLGPLVLTRGKRLEGRAIEPRDEVPIEGAEVWLVPSQLATLRAWVLFGQAGPAAVTDQDGRFILQGLDPRRPLHLEVCRPGYHTAWIFVESSEEDPIQVELPQAARLSGTVVDPEGKPVSGAHVDAGLSGAERPHFQQPSSPCPQLSKFSSAKTDTQGRFTLQPLDDGLFEIVAQAEGYRETTPQMVQVGAGSEAADLTLVLLRTEDTAPAAETVPATGTAPADPTDPTEELEPHDDREIDLSGRITGIEPEDLPDVEVYAHMDGRLLRGRYLDGFVDRHGIYRIPSLTPGEWTVGAVLEDRSAEGKIVIAPGDENPVLDLVFEEEPQ
ncbi:MAG TPA: carboxypeptidase regulatory-like domain-containing protein [Thermoanaerobaculia bacterium]|nr:carboxypeptidase regulatory-like domain-containing protein [Thermoanaerobaculia bacterium]